MKIRIYRINLSVDVPSFKNSKEIWRRPKTLTIYRNQRKIQGNDARNKTPAAIWINIRGIKRMGDLDGKIATVLDSLVDEKIIPDDRVGCLDRIFATFEKKNQAGIDILILEDK